MNETVTRLPSPPTVLRLDSSARHDGSISRRLADALMARLQTAYGDIATMHRDLSSSPPAFVDAPWVEANFTPTQERNHEQRAVLAESDRLVAELKAADIVVIGVPLYNFGIPAVLKAWVDMVARARVTFRYTDHGAEGLLTGKQAYILFASGGVAAGSEVDFASGYLQHILGFIGIDDVKIIAADATNQRGDAALAEALEQIHALPRLAGAA